MRRFQRRRRFGGRKPVARQSLSWVTTLFNETSLNVDASAATQQLLLNDDDWRGELSSLRQTAHVRRIIYDGVFLFTPTSAAGPVANNVSYLWAVLVIDDSEGVSAATLNGTGSGTIWQEKRVLQGGVDGFTSIELTGTYNQSVIEGKKIQFDLRTNAVVNPGSSVVMAFMFQGDATSTVSVANVSALSRVLIVTP